MFNYVKLLSKRTWSKNSTWDLNFSTSPGPHATFPAPKYEAFYERFVRCVSNILKRFFTRSSRELTGCRVVERILSNASHSRRVSLSACDTRQAAFRERVRVLHARVVDCIKTHSCYFGRENTSIDGRETVRGKEGEESREKRECTWPAALSSSRGAERMCDSISLHISDNHFERWLSWTLE